MSVTLAALPLASALPTPPAGLAPLPGQWAVVAGNGPSIADVPPGCVLATDWVVRVNNFFFEPVFHLGRRVDLVVLGGDPRIAPFVVETLRQSGTDYDLRAWTSHDSRVIRTARRLDASHLPMRLRDAHAAKALDRLRARYQREVTTGVFAVLMAHALGATRIVLAGLDLYGTTRRYSFATGRHQRDLLGADLDRRGADPRLHDPDLDRAVLEMLMARDDVVLYRAAPTPRLDDLMDLAPARPGAGIAPAPPEARIPPPDWAARSGVRSIGALKLLRRGSAILRRLRSGRDADGVRIGTRGP